MKRLGFASAMHYVKSYPNGCFKYDMFWDTCDRVVPMQKGIQEVADFIKEKIHKYFDDNAWSLIVRNTRPI